MGAGMKAKGWILVVAGMLASAGWARSAEILVFAAASLTDALGEIGRDYEKKSEERVLFSFAASSVLARQIQEGARVDLFISADEEKMDGLEKRGLIRSETRRSLLGNSLVVIVAKETALTVRSAEDLKQARRVAVAEPNTTPAGIYARRYLEGAGVWKELNIIPTQNVRGALAAVESGNAEIGVVYKTDAAMSGKVKIVYQIPVSAELKISYAAAVLKEGRRQDAAEAFLRELQSPRSARVFRRYGFVVLPAGK